jgi:asparagine synthase (glutamine-hydrolysing)
MCGISGMVSTEGRVDCTRLVAANAMVKYRGPDDGGYFILGAPGHSLERGASWDGGDPPDEISAALAFRRLSILDLSEDGHQPMHDGTRRHWIIFNGEVYNYIELRAELEGLGHSFRSKTDSEVALKAYLQWGESCLSRFNGMWAFAILDALERSLFCARDRFGVKPFYYAADRRSFLFGSEVKQVLALLGGRPTARRPVLFDYLALGAYGNETAGTFFQEVDKLPAGHFARIQFGDTSGIQVSTRPWWDLPEVLPEGSVTGEEASREVLALLESAVQLRLRSDVPVGTALSGGLDSSGLVCLVDRIGGMGAGPHRVFTVGSIRPEIDEKRYADLVIGRTKVLPFYEKPAGEDLANDLRRFVWHHDEPLISASMFGGYHLYRMARNRSVTVILDGQGADEFLGGYESGPQLDVLAEVLRGEGPRAFWGELGANAALYGMGRWPLLGALSLHRVRSWVRGAVPRSFSPRFRGRLAGWLRREFVEDQWGRSNLLTGRYRTDSRRFSSPFKERAYELIRYTNLPGILRQVDRNSMAFSVEARVPFLDYRLAEYLFALPPGLIMRGGYTKAVYRRAMRGVVPDEILGRVDKKGFPMPEEDLLRGAAPFVEAAFAALPPNDDVFDTSAVRKRVADILNGKAPYDRMVWRILNAATWREAFHVAAGQ